MKKITAVLALAFCLVVLTACGSKTESADASSNGPLLEATSKSQITQAAPERPEMDNPSQSMDELPATAETRLAPGSPDLPGVVYYSTDNSVDYTREFDIQETDFTSDLRVTVEAGFVYAKYLELEAAGFKTSALSHEVDESSTDFDAYRDGAHIQLSLEEERTFLRYDWSDFNSFDPVAVSSDLRDYLGIIISEEELAAYASCAEVNLEYAHDHEAPNDRVQSYTVSAYNDKSVDFDISLTMKYTDGTPAVYDFYAVRLFKEPT